MYLKNAFVTGLFAASAVALPQGIPSQAPSRPAGQEQALENPSGPPAPAATPSPQDSRPQSAAPAGTSDPAEKAEEDDENEDPFNLKDILPGDLFGGALGEPSVEAPSDAPEAEAEEAPSAAPEAEAGQPAPAREAQAPEPTPSAPAKDEGGDDDFNLKDILPGDLFGPAPVADEAPEDSASAPAEESPSAAPEAPEAEEPSAPSEQAPADGPGAAPVEAREPQLGLDSLLGGATGKDEPAPEDPAAAAEPAAEDPAAEDPAAAAAEGSGLI